MIRAALLALGLAALAPAAHACAVTTYVTPYWTVIPPDLHPGEIALEVEFTGDPRKAGSPAERLVFRVKRVVAGSFDAASVLVVPESMCRVLVLNPFPNKPNLLVGRLTDSSGGIPRLSPRYRDCPRERRTRETDPDSAVFTCRAF